MRTGIMAVAKCERRTSPLSALAHVAFGCSHHLLEAKKKVSISCATFAVHSFQKHWSIWPQCCDVILNVMPVIGTGRSKWCMMGKKQYWWIRIKEFNLQWVWREARVILPHTSSITSVASASHKSQQTDYLCSKLS